MDAVQVRACVGRVSHAMLLLPVGRSVPDRSRFPDLKLAILAPHNGTPMEALASFEARTVLNQDYRLDDQHWDSESAVGIGKPVQLLNTEIARKFSDGFTGCFGGYPLPRTKLMNTR